MIRCPNCGYEGKGKKLGTSCLDLLIAIFLLGLGILPGIIFLVWQQGKAHKVVCPACGFKNVVRLPKPQRVQPPQSLLPRLQSPQAQPSELQPLQSSLSQSLLSPEAKKSGVFTKQQIIILAVVACAVFCVLCFGGYIVISEENAYQQAIALPTKTLTLKPTEIPTATLIPTPTSRPTATVDPETAKAHWGNVDIRNLSKNPDNYFGQEVHYKGEVFTIEEDASGSAMQVWVDIPGGSEFDREAVVVLFEGATDNIYEGTEIEFWGYCMGTFEGTNAFGATIRQPMIAIEYLTYFR
jgi:DNA-directed RNA polymerase subunit RPC12/RpoP